MLPELIRIGPITIYSYGAMISIAIVLGLFLAWRQASREGIRPEVIVDFTLYAALAGLVGSRVLYVALHWSDYAGRPGAILGLGQGELQGLSIHGALLGGVLVGIFFARRYRLSFWRLADVYARPLAIGMGIGRVGCFLGGCCYGQLTGGGWGCTTLYAPGLRHPSQLYETALLVILFVFLSWYMTKPRASGQLFAVFLAGYAVMRFLAEIYRDSIRVTGPLSLAQLVSVALLVAGLILWRLRRGRPADQA